MKIEIWDNTEKNTCVYSFELEEEQIQKLVIKRNNNQRDSVFIDVGIDQIEVITADGSRVFGV
jgi:hypothetical protein